MSDEVMEIFIEQLIENIDEIKSTLLIVLQHYQVNIAEKEFEQKCECERRKNDYDEKNSTNCTL